LSGGNQQKVVLGRWLVRGAKVYILAEPTRGVDVGARAEMHALIRAAAAGGAAVLLTSTDVDELAGVCDRVVVFRRGRVHADLAGVALRPHAILEAMSAGAG
jgi:ABC-type sugar transport system ATPase subunit